MKSLCEKADVKYFRYHALRHFGASLIDQANIPIGSIQRLLGHENRTTTEIYLHSIGESERHAMDVLNDGFKDFSHTDSHTNKKDLKAVPCKSLTLLVRPAGFEPATYGFVVRRSVQAELRALTNFIEMSLPIKLYRWICQ